MFSCILVIVLIFNIISYVLNALKNPFTEEKQNGNII